MSRVPDPVRDAGSALSAVAQALYAAENGTDLVFVRAQADAGGPTGSAAAAIVDDLARLWEQYPVATEAVERLEAVAAARKADQVRRLLGPDGLALPDGSTTGLAGFLADLRRRVDAVVTESARLAGAARQAIARLDSASRMAADLGDRATAVGTTDDPELAAARQALEAAVAAVAADPVTTAPFAEVDRAIDVARRRVELVEEQRRDLPAALAAASRQLDEIRRLVGEGAAALGRARAGIADPDGLLEPLEASGVDGGERALGPWLDRIQEQADAGGWQAAAEGLDRWRKIADAWLANAERVATANQAPLRRRNELRGLLDAYRAKAVARGAVEDKALAALHQVAHDALHTAPCDLSAADAAVRRYVDAVNAASTSRR